MNQRFSRSGFAAAALLLCAGGAGAQQVAMHAVLDGAQDGTASTATGTATMVVDTAANTVTYSLSFSGLGSPQTAAHFHGPAPPGVPAGILHSIGVGSPINGVWNYAQNQEADILGGLTYINVHSQMLPGGEIRGQVCRTPIEFCHCDVGICGNPDADSGCANSTGAGADIVAGGLPSVALDSLTLSANPTTPNQFGLFFMGRSQVQLAFGDGIRCVGGTLYRFPVTNGGATGTIVLGPGIAAHAAASFPPGGQISAGTTVNLQCWYRDPQGPCGNFFNVSEAVSVTWTP